MNKIWSFLFLLLLFQSCQRAVSLDGAYEERLIVEGFIKSGETASIQLKKSLSATSQEDFLRLNTWKVSLENDLGEKEVLISNGSNIYESQQLKGEINRSYRIEIEKEDEIFIGNATIPENHLMTDSLVHEYVEFQDSVSQFQFSRLTLFAKTLDTLPALARVNISVNGSLFIENALLDYTAWNGSNYRTTWDFETTFLNGDVITVEILEMEQWLEDYFNEVDFRSGVASIGGLQISQPEDIENNFDGDILGYFGAYNKTEMELIIE